MPPRLGTMLSTRTGVRAQARHTHGTRPPVRLPNTVVVFHAGRRIARPTIKRRNLVVFRLRASEAGETAQGDRIRRAVTDRCQTFNARSSFRSGAFPNLNQAHSGRSRLSCPY